MENPDRDVDPGLLRERVYGKLKELLNEGVIRPGAFLDLSAIGRDLGLSRTPLRDALIRLEIEGFVRIYPRRGVMVRALDLPTIRKIYELIGALESFALLSLAGSFRDEDAEAMAERNREAREALDRDDFAAYYRANLAFHGVYLALCDNDELLGQLSILKERLYDFPRRAGFVPEWERMGVGEHDELRTLLERRDFAAASIHIRDVHWSWAHNERFIRRYYADTPARRD